MKRFSVYLLIVVIVLTPISSAFAQANNDPPEIRDLRANIKRMEGMQVSQLAPSMLEIYKRTLLGFYEELLRYVQKQIDSTQAAHVRERLNQQKTQLQDNIAILKMSLGVPERSSVEASNTRPVTEATLQAESVAAPSQPTTNPTGNIPGASKPEPAPSTPTTQPIGPSNAVTTSTQPAASSTAAATTAATSTGNTATVAPGLAVPPPPCDYSKVAPILKDAAQRTAGSILIQPVPPDEQVQAIDSDVNKLVFYALADALNIQVAGDPGKPPVSFSALEPYHYLGETVRTDKQLGSSSSSSSASVSRFDRAGFAWLLGLGIENGLVERDVRDTVLTLSTSPAALYMLDRNAPNPYKNAGFLNRIGVSASFNISNKDQLLANATRSQLREYSIKYRFAGDRSPRSDKLEKIWDDVAPAIQNRLIALNRAAIYMDRDLSFLNPLVAKTNSQLQDRVKTLITSDSFKAETDKTKKTDAVTGVILCYLLENVYAQKGNINQAVVTEFTDILVPNLVSAQAGLKIVREEFNKRRDEFFEGPLGTIAYINRREPVFGNYSEFKFLFEHPTPILGPVNLEKLTANAGFSFYHQPNAALRQERMRGVNGVISFEGSMRNPFAETIDLDRITYSLTGRYDRLFENSRTPGRKGDLASFQFLMNFPIYKGFAFPFSLTYSNATETDRRKGWQTNFGFKLDADKLKELVRAASAP